MFGIHVRVHPMFWLVSAMLGYYPGKPLKFLAVWIVCAFVSILIHELGHVVTGRMYGAEGHIVLYSFGGLAIGSNRLADRWHRIVVCFAGPLAGFLLLGFIMLVLKVLAPDHLTFLIGMIKFYLGLGHPVFPPTENVWLETVIKNMVWINLFWGILNLLPIWPLDGGQISKDFLDGLIRQSGGRIALGISLVLSGFLAICCISASYGHPLVASWPLDSLYSGIFFALLALGSFQALQAEEQRRRFQDEHFHHWDHRDRWDDDRDSYE